MAPYETLITFYTKEDMEASLTLGADFMMNYFSTVRQWFDDVQCKTRTVWEECFGLPPHAWSKDNLKKIGGIWGIVVGMDDKTKDGANFSLPGY